MNIQYIKGDATSVSKGIIAHCCNDIGAWGAGFVLAISKKWPKVEKEYKKWHKEGIDADFQKFSLGNVQFVNVDTNLYVANIIGQYGTYNIDINPSPIRYSAIRGGLKKVANFAAKTNLPVVMPKIGAGLARGNWETIEKIIVEELVDKNIQTSVYCL
jgi:O-acetyl-ADP-ribose deacetylase (regulator of RNase III)